MFLRTARYLYELYDKPGWHASNILFLVPQVDRNATVTNHYVKIYQVFALLSEKHPRCGWRLRFSIK